MAKTSESLDVWDQDSPGSGRAGSTFVKRMSVAKARVVRDDWDDDDDEEEEEQAEGERDAMQTRNDVTGLPWPGSPGRRDKAREREEEDNIWEEANKRVPMPELIVAPASTSQSFPPPPPAALQPTLRILKRPSPNNAVNSAGAVPSGTPTSSSPGPTSGSSTGTGSGVTSPAPRGTLAEREAQYQEARSRIFGEKEKLGNSSGVVVVRDPLGPASEPELEPGMSGQDKGPVCRLAKGFGERRKK